MPAISRQRTIRFRLICLAAACMVPVWLAAGFLVYYSYQYKRALTEQHMLETARALTLAVDRELASMQAAVEALATSPSLASGDLSAFYRQAQVVLRAHPDADIILSDADGRQAVNTFKPFGTPLPKRNAPDVVRRTFESGRPSISNLFVGAVTGRTRAGVDVPVFRDGRVIYDLAMTVPAEYFVTILSRQRLPPERVGTIFDNHHMVVARTRGTEKFVGRQAAPELLPRITADAEGTLEATNLEHLRVIDSFSRSTIAGWTVVISEPKATLMAELRRWLWWTLAGAILLFVTSIGLALRIGRLVARSVQGLITPALALGRGDPIAIAHLDLAETNEVGRSLLKASELLAQRAAEHERAEAARRETAELKRFNTQLERSEAEAHARAQELAAIMDAVPAITFIARDPECHRMTSSRAAYDLFRLPPGTNTSKSAPEDERPSHYRILKDGRELSSQELPMRMAAKTGREIRGFEYTVAFTDGSSRDLFGNAVPLLDETGRVRGAVGAFLDVTTHKQSQSQLQATARRLQGILENAPIAITIVDREGRVLEPNPALSRMVGYSEEELIGKKFSEYTHPDDAVNNMELHSGLDGGEQQTYELEKRLIRKDGGVIWVHVKVAALDDNRRIAIAEDITARKHAEEELQATAERLRAILENAPIGINIVDRDARLLESNAAYQTITGYSAEELQEMSFKDYTHPDDLKHNLEIFDAASEAELEKRYVRKDGKIIWVRVRNAILDCKLRIGIVEEITERVLVQEQLKKTAERLQLILDRAPLGVSIVRYDGHLIETNPAFQQIMGYSAEELRAKTFLELTHPDDLPRSLEIFDRAKKGRLPLYAIEKRFIRKNGQAVWVRLVGSVVDAEYHMGIIEDITDRKRATEQLQHSEAQVRRLIESNIVGVIIGRTDGTIAEANDALLKITGYTREDIERGLRWRDLTAPEHQASVDKGIEQMRQTGGFQSYEKEYVRKDGSRVPVMVAGTRIEGERNETIVFVFDLTERNKTRNELERLARIVESADNAIISVALDGIILSWNQGAERLFGYTAAEIIGTSEERLLPAGRDEEKESIQEVVASGKGLDRLRTARITKTGEEIFVSLMISPIRDESGRIVSLAKIIRDRTTVIKAEQLQEQLRQSQKFEAIGLLAGGVAHDFNNLLTIVSLYAHLLEEQLGQDNKLRKYTQELVEASNRGAALTRKLLAFSRRQALTSRVIDLNEVIASTVEMIRRLIGEDIELTFSPSDQPCAVKADPDQMGEVLLNLCVNARDAMPEGGKLTIAAECPVLEDTGDRPSLVPRRYSKLIVTDTGAGMTEEVRGRIFEPFFTTKEVGKGTGLGLAMVYGFVEQSGGYIQVSSTPGRGTSFQLYFPAVEEDKEMVSPTTNQPSRANGHGETILVVEDEDVVREVVASHLKNQGYKTIEASNGEEGLQVASQYAGAIQLLLTDITMPKMNGIQMAQALRKSRPETAVIYMSGYSDRLKDTATGLQGVLLEKPFSQHTLSEQVSKAIASSGQR